MANSKIDWTLQGLDNPDVIQHQLLQRFEKETGAVIVDNNNPACVLMEAFASMSAAQMRMMDDNVRPAVYPSRAVTTVDLLKHISDYDYVDIFSAPCSATIMLIVEKNYIMTHSVAVPGKEYKKLEIPRSTQITIGEHTFGLYYPIEIRSNLNSGQFTVLYDMSQSNPLKTLDTNVLDFDFREFNGHKLVYIKIPVYQFKVKGHDLQMINHSGFKQTVEYTDRFYALRCWADVITNFGHDETEEDKFERKELSLAVAGQTYDPTDPTIIFTPDENNKECLLEIPYIYFMEGRIRGTLHVDIYTTEGELNYQVPYNTAESCVIDMFSNISQDEEEQYNAITYAEPFRTMPALHTLPLSSHIVGGKNGLTFEQIRSRVINGVETNVLQTPADISAYFAAYGYTATLYRDGITDRIFIVHAAVRDNENAIIGMDSIPTLFDFARIKEYGTIVKAEDSESTYTVLPSTLYRFDTSKQICVPLTDVERKELNEMSPEDKVNAYNNNVFTLSPFHLQINAAAKYPTTISYDMLQCKRLARTFVAARDDRYGLALNAVNLDVYRRAGDIKDRYRLLFRVARVGFGINIPVMETDEKGQAEKKIRVLIGLKNDDEQFKYAEAQWIATEPGDDDNSTNEVFELILTPNFVFHQANNEHSVQMAFWDNPDYTDFLLTSECRVILLLKDGLNLSKPQPSGNNVPDGVSIYQFEGEQCLETKFSSGQMVLPTGKKVSITSDVGLLDYFAVTEQKCVFQFGSPIDELDQRINLTYSEAVYKKHLTTKFRTLEDDKLDRDQFGNLKLSYSYEQVGAETSHKYYVKGVLYFRKEGTIYKPIELTEEKYNTEITENNVFIRSVTPQIQVLFPKGTLTCMTVTDKESVVPNKYTYMNYAGCTVVDEDGNKHVMTDAELQTAVDKGTELSLEDTPTSPRFLITNAASANAACVGKFELANALQAKPISSMTDVWAHAGNSGDTETGRRNVVVQAKNALQFIIATMVGETNTRQAAAQDDDPLKSIKMEVGSFLLLENDYSEPGFIQLGTLGEDWEPDQPKVYTRLYYKFRNLTADEKAEDERLNRSSEKNTWYCFCQGKTKDTILSFLAEEALDGEERNPKFYGMLYLIASVEGDKHATGRADSLKKMHYVSFLTNMKYVSKSEAYVLTEDVMASATKIYYVSPAAGLYRVCTEEDFNEDGSFVTGTKYYEHKLYEETYEIPDFNSLEKSAWEAHQVKVPIGDEVIVVEGRKYCYKDKELYTLGIEKWIDVDGVEVGHPITDYITVEETGDGIYYKKDYAQCTDKDYAWEQNANRWPWEVSNWKMFGESLKSDESVDHIYLMDDAKLIVKSDWDRLHRYWEYSSDQVIMDDHNKPLEDLEKDRSIQYLCDMLQMDAKLAQVTVIKEDTSLGSDFEDDGPTSRTYPTTVVKILRTHFDNVGNARDTMFTNTRLFFEPVKSLGFADFNVGNGVTKTLPLDISMKFRLHVTKDVYEDDVLLIQLKKQIVGIIDEQIDSGHVNCAEIANKIVEMMNGSVKWVDVLGINGDPDLQTMKCDNEAVRPHLAHKLTLLDDGITIDVERALEIEAVVNE